MSITSFCQALVQTGSAADEVHKQIRTVYQQQAIRKPSLVLPGSLALAGGWMGLQWALRRAVHRSTHSVP